MLDSDGGISLKVEDLLKQSIKMKRSKAPLHHCFEIEGPFVPLLVQSRTAL